MLVRVDQASAEPLFVQIAASIRGAIGANEVRRGDQLPPLRQLAAALGVNMHTVRAAYGVLRDEGLIEMRRGRSVTVIADHPGRADLVTDARALIRTARRLGLTDAEIRSLIEESL